MGYRLSRPFWQLSKATHDNYGYHSLYEESSVRGKQPDYVVNNVFENGASYMTYLPSLQYEWILDKRFIGALVFMILVALLLDISPLIRREQLQGLLRD